VGSDADRLERYRSRVAAGAIGLPVPPSRSRRRKWISPVDGLPLIVATTIRLRPETKAKLDELRRHPRETYDEVISRLADAAYDDEPLSEEEIDAIRRREGDLRAGRVRSLREVMRDLDDDVAIRERCPDSEFVPLPE
jgi:predicted transcriptional regulator